MAPFPSRWEDYGAFLPDHTDQVFFNDLLGHQAQRYARSSPLASSASILRSAALSSAEQSADLTTSWNTPWMVTRPDANS